jgi:hypothetical protein
MRLILFGSAAFAAIGAFIASGILYVADFPHWTPYVWPTWWWLMGANTHEPGFLLGASIAVFSNAVIYAAAGAVIFGVISLLRRAAQ